MRRRSLLVLALCSFSLVAPAASSHAQQKPSDTLFTVEKYLDYEQVADPQISPDGAQVVYTRRYVNKMEDRWDAALWIMNADGSRNRFLAKGASPRWSPDGTRLAFLNDGEPSGTQLFVRFMEAPASVTQVTRVSEPIGDIRWSPDGKSIGFSMFVPVERNWQIDMPKAPAGAKWTPAPKYETDLHYRQDRRGFNRSGYTHLFVVPAARGQGIAEALIGACLQRSRQHGATSLAWQTARTNERAQRLYGRLGAQREEWLDYSLQTGR